MKVAVSLLLIIIGFFNPFQSLLAQNVGINTTTLQAALDIKGDIVLRPVVLTAADGIWKIHGKKRLAALEKLFLKN